MQKFTKSDYIQATIELAELEKKRLKTLIDSLDDYKLVNDIGSLRSLIANYGKIEPSHDFL